MTLARLAVSFVFLLLALGAGCARETAAPTETSTSTMTVESPTASPSEPEAVHPVSLPALFTRTYDGRELVLGRVLSANDVYTQHYITYRSGELTISGIMNIPKGNGPFPLVLTNHGYIDTSVYTNGRGLRREQDYFARRGFAVLHPDYRNHADSTDVSEDAVKRRLGYIDDVINAVVAVRAADLPTIDERNIFMLGHSMGGGIGQGIMVAQPGLVRAHALYAPVSGLMRENYDEYISERPSEVQAVDALYGSPTNAPEFWDNVSPRTFYDRVTEPVMVHIGTNDADTDPAWSRAIADRLRELGKDVTLHEYPGEGHEFSRDWGLMMDRTREFFTKHLLP